jgi:hypothetical protein
MADAPHTTSSANSNATIKGRQQSPLMVARLPASSSPLSTSGETLTIEESMNLEGENGERRNVGDDEHEWSWSCG